MSKTLLILGGTGFIGKHAAREQLRMIMRLISFVEVLLQLKKKYKDVHI